MHQNAGNATGNAATTWNLLDALAPLLSMYQPGASHGSLPKIDSIPLAEVPFAPTAHCYGMDTAVLSVIEVYIVCVHG